MVSEGSRSTSISSPIKKPDENQLILSENVLGTPAPAFPIPTVDDSLAAEIHLITYRETDVEPVRDDRRLKSTSKENP